MLIKPEPLPTTDPAVNTLPCPVLVTFVWERPVLITAPVQSGVILLSGAPTD